MSLWQAVVLLLQGGFQELGSELEDEPSGDPHHFDQPLRWWALPSGLTESLPAGAVLGRTGADYRLCTDGSDDL